MRDRISLLNLEPDEQADIAAARMSIAEGLLRVKTRRSVQACPTAAPAPPRPRRGGSGRVAAGGEEHRASHCPTCTCSATVGVATAAVA